MINRKALFFHEWENRGISVLVKMLMDEMRQKKSHFNDCVRGLLIAFLQNCSACVRAMPRRMK